MGASSPASVSEQGIDAGRWKQSHGRRRLLMGYRMRAPVLQARAQARLRDLVEAPAFGTDEGLSDAGVAGIGGDVRKLRARTSYPCRTYAPAMLILDYRDA